jgi:hypothetical protein
MNNNLQRIKDQTKLKETLVVRKFDPSEKKRFGYTTSNGFRSTRQMSQRNLGLGKTTSQSFKMQPHSSSARNMSVGVGIK